MATGSIQHIALNIWTFYHCHMTWVNPHNTWVSMLNSTHLTLMTAHEWPLTPGCTHIAMRNQLQQLYRNVDELVLSIHKSNINCYHLRDKISLSIISLKFERQIFPGIILLTQLNIIKLDKEICSNVM